MPTSISVRLDRALAATDDGEFLRQLAEIDRRFNVVDLQDRPEPPAMFGGLWILHLDVQLEGIWKYLAQSEGDTFADALQWCRDIGASRTLAYLQAVRRLFPGGRLSSDASDRHDVIEKLESRAIKTGSPEPFRVLDDKYRAVALPELAQRLRAWLKVTAQRSSAISPPHRRLPAGFALTQQLRSGRLGNGKAYSQRHARHTDAVKRLFELTDALPRQATVGGKKIGLLLGAHHTAAASLAVRLHEWLMLTPEGTEHARHAYAPFADLGWTPPISARGIGRGQTPRMKRSR